MQIEVFMAHVRIDVKNTTGKFIKLCTRRSFEQIFFFRRTSTGIPVYLWLSRGSSSRFECFADLFGEIEIKQTYEWSEVVGERFLEDEAGISVFHGTQCSMGNKAKGSCDRFITNMCSD